MKKAAGASEFICELKYERQPADALCEAATNLRRIYAEDLQDRLFIQLCRRDLIMLMLDISVDAKSVLDDDSLHARAEQEFSFVFHQVEQELNLPPLCSTAQAHEMSNHHGDAPDLTAMAAALSGAPLSPSRV